MPVVCLGVFGVAGATPALPTASLAEAAVRDALTPVVPAAQAKPQAPAQQATPAPTRGAQTQTAQAQPTPAQVREAEVARAEAQAAQARAQAVQAAGAGIARATRTGRSVIARATAYNSAPGQTDSTPFVTATGTRVRNGVVALSRDLLRVFPYGTKVTVEDLSGRTGNLLSGQVFSVEDTMASYKSASIDIWMPSRSQAIRFGARQVRVTAVR